LNQSKRMHCYGMCLMSFSVISVPNNGYRFCPVLGIRKRKLCSRITIYLSIGRRIISRKFKRVDPQGWSNDADLCKGKLQVVLSPWSPCITYSALTFPSSKDNGPAVTADPKFPTKVRTPTRN